MSSAICFGLDQSKILLSGNGLITDFHASGWRVTCLLMYIFVMTGLYISPVFIDCPCLIRGENLPEKPRLVGHRGAMSVSISASLLWCL